jgi:tetratricopeptide (TPR) repeat protein
MLFPPHSVDIQRAQILRDLMDEKIGEAAAAERILAIDPGFAGAYIFLGNARLTEDAVDEAEALFWTALEHAPCGATPYLALAEMQKRRPNESLAMHFTHLAMWKLALSEEIIESVADRFRAIMPDAEIDFRKPEAYEMLAVAIEQQMEKAEPRPEPPPRLKPFRVLNDLQYEAPEGLAQETLDEILANGPECLPVWRAALQEWARRPVCISIDGIAMVIATLGEISGPAIVDDLLDLVTYNDRTVSRHVYWAIWRIGQRFPAETLAILRAARPSANVSTRCGIAEQIMLLPDQAEGAETALLELLEGFAGMAREEDAPFLLLAVTEALRRRGSKRKAREVLERYQELLPKKSRRWLRQQLESEGGFLPNVEHLGIAGLDIDDICGRALMDDEEEEDGDDAAHGDDDGAERPPAIRPGRNDPCWCGSGKKYKKCHLASDEQSDPSEAEESHSNPLVGKVLGDILDCAGDWHNLADIAAAHRLYFDREPTDSHAEDLAEGSFIEWYVMDFRSPSTGRTLVQEYLRRRGPRLPERERALVESWRDLRFGFWEVQRVEEGEGLELKNVLEGDTLFVHDVAGSKSQAQWDCHIARINQFEGEWQFVGNAISVPRPLREQFTDLLEGGARAAGQSPAEHFRAGSHTWKRVLEGLYRQMRRDLRIVNAEGNALEFCNAIYQLLDLDAAAAALLAAKMFEDTTSASDPPGMLHFGWLETGGDGPRRSYGSIELGEGELRLECNSRERLAIGRQLVEKHAGSWLRHIEDRFTSLEEAMKNAKASDASEASTKLPPEVEREVVLKLKAEHYAKWPDEPLPALDGRTPREAARTETGRSALHDLLRDMENAEEHERRHGRPAYDFRQLRETLGL